MIPFASPFVVRIIRLCRPLENKTSVMTIFNSANAPWPIPRPRNYLLLSLFSSFWFRGYVHWILIWAPEEWEGAGKWRAAWAYPLGSRSYLGLPSSVIIVVPCATIAIPWFPLYFAGTSLSSRTHAAQFWHSQVDFTCIVSNYPLHILQHRILRRGIRHFTFALARWGREEQRHKLLLSAFISNVTRFD